MLCWPPCKRWDRWRACPGADRWDGLAQYALQFWHAFNVKMLSNTVGLPSDNFYYSGDGVLDWFSVKTRWQALDQTIDPRNPPATYWQQTVDFTSGVIDTITGGLTMYLRQYLQENIGLPDPVNYNSSAYRVGGQVGQLLGVGMMLFGVGAPGLLTTALYFAQTGGQIVSGVYLYADGDIVGAAVAFAGAALSAMGPFVSPCSRASTLMAWGQRILHGVAAGKGVVAAFGDFAHGDTFGGFVNLVDAAANLYMGTRACFPARSPLRTRDGYKMIEEFKPGDMILSRDENNPDGPVAEKTVEQIFERYAFILHLHVPGQVIRTTGEHPFYVQGKGWLAAHDLKIDDLLNTEEGGWVPVEDLLDTGEYEKVYNLRVADWHTYFVGAKDWGFSVWAHNAYNGTSPGPETDNRHGHNRKIRQVAREVTANGETVLKGGRSFDGTLRREAVIETLGGFKGSRRPDILVQHFLTVPFMASMLAALKPTVSHYCVSGWLFKI